jgi:hypothetical protein
MGLGSDDALVLTVDRDHLIESLVDRCRPIGYTDAILVPP